ncbi:RNA binding protein Rnp24 [Penicillium herquei]|nr:RNA binding protein Rnp24 [Penicillium herquei]
MSESPDITQKKRKLQDGPEIEIDVSAPEPQSKKALRKAKKQKSEPTKETSENDNEDEKPQTAKPYQAPAAPKRSEYGIWIGNLAFSTTRDDLRTFFTSNCSFDDETITRINMPKGQERFGKVQNKGFAYVDFTTKEALDEAIGLSEQLVTGRRVLIKNAKSYEGRPDKPRDQENAATAKPGHPPSRRIFVGNLGFDVTKEIVEQHFAQCGPLTNVHMATFQDSGKCKGYGWVEFEDIASAETAVKGYMMVGDDDEESSDSSDSESDAAADKKKKRKSKKVFKRKVWVNQLMGRRMRMEFAEDATTRYKKRFGKDGEGKKSEDGEGDAKSESRPRVYKPKKPEFDESRYSKDTVQRLSGAIVEGQGSKITFD